jgi:hypothetical protein
VDTDRTPLQTPLRDTLETVTKAALAFVALSYALGMLIVNVRLQRYGILAMNLVRVQYVMAGTTFLVLNLVGYLSGALCLRVLRSLQTSWRTKRRIEALFGVLLALVVPVSLAGFTLEQLSDYELYLNDWHLWAGIVAVLLMSLASWNLVSAGHITFSSWRRGEDDRYSRAHSLIADVSGFLTMLVLYAFFVYPQIQPAYGGGRPVVAQLVLTTDAPPAVRGLLLGAAVDKNLSTVTVLADTGEYLVVEAGTRPFQAIAVKKDLVVAVGTN